MKSNVTILSTLFPRVNAPSSVFPVSEPTEDPCVGRAIAAAGGSDAKTDMFFLGELWLNYDDVMVDIW